MNNSSTLNFNNLSVNNSKLNLSDSITSLIHYPVTKEWEIEYTTTKHKVKNNKLQIKQNMRSQIVSIYKNSNSHKFVISSQLLIVSDREIKGWFWLTLIGIQGMWSHKPYTQIWTIETRRHSRLTSVMICEEWRPVKGCGTVASGRASAVVTGKVKCGSFVASWVGLEAVTDLQSQSVTLVSCQSPLLQLAVSTRMNRNIVCECSIVICELWRLQEC